MNKKFIEKLKKKKCHKDEFKKLDKFMILKGSGGITHMLSSIVYTIKLAMKYRYFLIIDVCNYSSFLVPFSDFFYLKNVKYSEDYNDIPNTYKYYDMTVSDCHNNCKFKYDPKYHYICNDKYVVNKNTVQQQVESRRDIVMYIGAGDFDFLNMSKYIRINRNVLKYIQSRKITNKYIGVHYRNTDIQTNFDETVQEIQLALQNNKEINTIYFATDHFDSIQKFQNTFTDYNFIYYTVPYKNIRKNIHYSNPNKKELHTNLLLDMYLLTYSTVFIGSMRSGISCWVEYMRRNKDFRLFEEF